MFSLPPQSTGELKTLGTHRAPWVLAREEIRSGLSLADGLLVAYGTAAPTGPARHLWRDQISWLRAEIEPLGIPVWSVGDEPRHPSRWHRHTFREYPGMPFENALSHVLKNRHVSENGLLSHAEP